MTSEAITSAIRSALGDYASPEKIRELDAVLRPIYGVEAKQRRAPVQGFAAGIPWEMHLRAYDAYSKKWGPQKALIEGGCRGGFWVEELDQFIPGWRDELSKVSRLRALLARAEEALKPFYLLAPFEARGWADEHGWTDLAPKNERICDWFGPTDFRTARTVSTEIEKEIGHD